MSGYSSIRKIKILDDPDEVNKLLKDWWELLEIYRSEFGILFVLGRSFYESINEFRRDFTCEGAI